MPSICDSKATTTRPVTLADLEWIARQGAEVHDLRIQQAERDGRLYDCVLGMVVEYR